MTIKRPKSAPEFRSLTQTECRDILRRNTVARLAFVFRGRVDIEPIHYVFRNGEIVFRTSRGSKFEVLTHAPWVAFEVDEIDGMFDWRSVVVHGTVYEVRDSGPDVAEYRRAIAALRTLLPSSLRSGDPVAFRDIVVGLFVDKVTGREARSRTMPKPRKRRRRAPVRR